MSITKHGVTFADAYTEGAAIAYVGRALLDCFALSHSLFPDGALYFVNDFQPFTASVPDIGTITFLARPVQIGRPQESDQASSPEIRLDVDNVSGGISRLLKLVRGVKEPIMLTNYKYASDDTSGPVVTPPTVVEVRSTSYDEQTASLSCMFGDAGNLAFPGLTFKRDEYVTLSRQS